MPKSSYRTAVLAAGMFVAGCVAPMSTVTLRYGLELEDRDGPRFVEEDFAFRSGDRFRFVIESESSVYAYLFNRGEGEPSYGQLVPGMVLELPSNREVAVPPDGWYRMDEDAGTELMVLVVATEPVDELEFYDEEDLLAAAFERRLGDLERTRGPLRFRRRAVDERVELVAERPAAGEPIAIVVRIPLQHTDAR